jgi:hypothetical protein
MAKPSFCALCKEPKTLVDSHIVPRFFLRAATSEIREGKKTGLRETSVMKFGSKPESRDLQEGSFERHHGLVQKLLCKECDAKIGKWEDYARKILYGNSPGPDIRKRELGQSITAELGTRNANVKYFRDLRQVPIDYKKFKLFELSILWRAGLESKSWGKEVKLGPFQEDIRKHLLHDDPGAALYLPAILVDLRDKAVDFEALLPSVELLAKKPFHLYRMALGGYWLLYSVSKKYVASEAPHFCLQENGNLRIIVAEGRPIVEQLATLFQQLAT